MICVENLCRNYGDYVAVKNITFTLAQGEVVGLLGHNGAGKTTIMKMLTGCLEPTSGRVLFIGKDVEVDPISMQQQLGYLPENLPIYPEMMVAEYLEYVASVRGIPQDERPEAITLAMKKTALQAKALVPISTLSRGFKQRLGVAQAIIHKPKLLILDEPTNGLDPEQVQQMRELIKELAKEALVILSTHVLQEVEAVCDRALIIRRGELVMDARLEALRDSGYVELVTNADRQSIEALSASVDGIEGWNLRSRDVDGFYCYHIKLNAAVNQTSVIATLAKAIIEHQFELIRLVTIQHDLETIFRQISLGEDRTNKMGSTEVVYV